MGKPDLISACVYCSPILLGMDPHDRILSSAHTLMNAGDMHAMNLCMPAKAHISVMLHYIAHYIKKNANLRAGGSSAGHGKTRSD
jgi:hypothetical protein